MSKAKSALLRSRGALLCCAALIAAAIIIHPVAESGINDDWSYTKSAQVLAQTGHIVYNGWAAMTLGWQLAWGAIAIKLFGFSFLSVRLSGLAIGICTAFLMQKTLVRAGLNDWNATLVTLTMSLSPLYLPLSLSFMSDIPGLLALVLCFYACLRALEAERDRRAGGWIFFAVVSNVVLGSARQTGWLGLFVIIPSALWLLRGRKAVFQSGAACWIAGLCAVGLILRWYSHQLYICGESLLPSHIDFLFLIQIVSFSARALWEFPFLLLPLLLAFVPLLSAHRKRIYTVATLTIFVSLILGWGGYRHGSRSGLEPILINVMTRYGAMQAIALNGAHQPVLGATTQLLLTIATAFCLFSFLGVATVRRSENPFSHQALQPVVSRKVCWLTLPFCTAYFALLLPRAGAATLFDRYLLPLLFVAALFLALYYQQRISPRLPLSVIAAICIMAAYSIATTHDEFAVLRAQVRAQQALTQAGVSIRRIDGGFEYVGWNEIEIAGYYNNDKITNPRNAFRPIPEDPGKICRANSWMETPDIRPDYGLSYSPSACGGPAPFAPVSYRTWLPWRENFLYTVRYAAP